MSTTSNLDLSAGTSSTSLNGLLLKPPTVGSNTNFTIPGLFQTIGKTPSPGVNFTLIGGSDSSNQLKIVVPPGDSSAHEYDIQLSNLDEPPGCVNALSSRFSSPALTEQFLGLPSITDRISNRRDCRNRHCCSSGPLPGKEACIENTPPNEVRTHTITRLATGTGPAHAIVLSQKLTRRR